MNTDDSFSMNNVKRLPEAFFNNIEEMTQRDVSFVVANTLLSDKFPSESLRAIVDKWIVSESTFKAVGQKMYAYEYLSGPTMSVYDLHARLLALVLENNKANKTASCSVADSSSAVCQAFKSISGCSPYILQAVGVLSELEKRQLVSIVPGDMLCVVKCDEATLVKLTQRAVDQLGSANGVNLVTDDNLYYRVSRVAMLFDMYRRLKAIDPGKKFVFACDKSSKSCMDACQTAVKMGLPVRIVETEPTCDRDEVIVCAYKTTGYILSPRAVAQWVTLDQAQLGDNEIGIFVQPSHPAKNRKLIEPLINQVIPLPHKLYFNQSIHPRYKFNAPTVNTIINFLTN